MDILEAREILVSLVDGYHPITGEKLPATDVTFDETVSAALHTAALGLEELRELKFPVQYPRAGEKWTHAEDVRLASEFQSGMSLAILSATHARSRRSIVERLLRLGLIRHRSELG